MTRLNRTAAKVRPPATVRAVHLGLGAFHRAHQAVYTMADPEWGIAAYTFRSTELPRILTKQDGLYSLRISGDATCGIEIIDSISRAHPGGDTEQWLSDLASPEVALVTLTITETAYYPERGRPESTREDTAMGRLLAGLRQRYQANGAPIALVPCDNLPDNGSVLRWVLRTAAAGCVDGFHSWLEESVSCVSTVVDRITPATTNRDLATAAQLLGMEDNAAVVTEPFSEWLLAGYFPLGRPAWETAGARIVDDLGAYQQRKLWFLNGAHSLLAYAGSALGCETVDEAIQHPLLSGLVESWWNAAARHASLDSDELVDYRHHLHQRFASPGIRHHLPHIAADGSQKLPARILPVLRAERSQGRLPESAVAALAGWLVHLRTDNVRDSRAAELMAGARSANATRRTLAELGPDLADDDELIKAVDTAVDDLTRRSS